ncbi:hypothetical protein EPUS_06699 [Endocarpon pusillum Z07020]|uniref:Xylanolytic transcriptional activator regulatory domain-containing protein n=1 Tax=Endocarpon pusillum (strain Z07020 / HMAS-L-300199) TaxID=1263415 RepID=U1FVZ1_ENDPU|nr:uncharacterized protein EPUS_06699 [Endocarpon pusillum Z07020]ERF69012.1 hypothetical protein EPUS_06699 [Endocarpon pusillum Z07020]
MRAGSAALQHMSARKARKDLANRRAGQLRHLEDLVIQISSPTIPLGLVEGQISLASEQKETAQNPQDAAMNGLTGVASYVGPLHWSAVLENIQELKSAMASEYDKFWRKPKQVSPIWLGQLFAILSISVRFHEEPVDEIPASTACHYMSNLDSVQEVRNSLGIVVRLAMRMGYHRDAKQIPGITAFEGEMRRRAWAVIQQVDLLLSFQMGLPSLVQADTSDAELPRNLLDNEFDELTPHLPASRSDTGSIERRSNGSGRSTSSCL